MVIIAKDKQDGVIMAEMMVAIAILVIAVLPLAFSVVGQARVLRASYQKAVAMEIVDGEMEVLAAGQWRNVAEGTHAYTVHCNAATNLPPGKFEVSRTSNTLRLRWSPSTHSGVGPIEREVRIR